MIFPAFDPAKFVDFIHELQTHGFIISTEQYGAAQDLLITLAAQGRIPANPQALSSWLAPILCTSPEEQRIFHEQFEQWHRQQLKAYKIEQEQIKSKQIAHIDLPVTTISKWYGSKPEIRTGSKRRFRIRPLIKYSVRLIILAAIIFAIYLYVEAPDNLIGYVSDGSGMDKRAVINATITIADQTTTSDERGRFSLKYYPKDLPLNLSVSCKDYETFNENVDATTVQPLNIPLKKKVSPIQPPGGDSGPGIKLPDQGGDGTEPLPDDPNDNVEQDSNQTYQGQLLKKRSTGYGEYLKPVPIGAMLLPFLIFGLWQIYSIRRLRLMKQSTGEDYLFKSIKVRGATSQIFLGQNVRRASRELRRHRQFGSNEIDPHLTVNATIREGGWFTPVYGLRHEQPEYIALIERASFNDQQSQMEDALINRLFKEGVIVDRYYFHGSPLVCREEDPAAAHIDLQELISLYPNRHLLLFSDGKWLTNTLTGEPQRWLDMLSNWPVRVLLTPGKPHYLSYHESILSDQGFMVIPASEEGLAALIETIRTGKISKFDKDNKTRSFPEMLYERPVRWLENHEPSYTVTNQLCFQLRRFLGDVGYCLLGACAVYPMLNWQLTLHLAHSLIPSDDLEDKLWSLVRLPWFRHGSIPDWLRLQFISAMPKNYEERTRQILMELLESSLEKSGGRNFELLYVKGNETNDDASGSKGLWHGFIKKIRAWRRKQLWASLIRSRSKQSALRDYVFLTFMSGRRPRKLSLNVPNTLRFILYPEGQGVLGLRFTVGLLFTALCSALTLAVLSVQSQRYGYEELRFLLTIKSPPYTVPLPPDSAAPSGNSQPKPKKQLPAIHSMAFSPNGGLLASVSANDIKLWDTSTGNEFKTLKGHSSTIYCLAFSPDGNMLASGSWDKTIKLWDLGTGKELATLQRHSDVVYCVAFSPDGKTLASGSADNTIKLWDLSTGNEIRTLTGLSATVYSVAFSPGGNMLASGSWDGTVSLWDLSTANRIIFMSTGHRLIFRSLYGIRCVAFSPDGNVLASGGLDNTVRLWDLRAGYELNSLKGNSNAIYSVKFSPDGKMLASDSQVWDLGTGNELVKLKAGSITFISSVFSQDGKALAVGTTKGTIKLWDLTGITE